MLMTLTRERKNPGRDATYFALQLAALSSIFLKTPLPIMAWLSAATVIALTGRRHWLLPTRWLGKAWSLSLQECLQRHGQWLIIYGARAKSERIDLAQVQNIHIGNSGLEADYGEGKRGFTLYFPGIDATQILDHIQQLKITERFAHIQVHLH